MRMNMIYQPESMIYKLSSSFRIYFLKELTGTVKKGGYLLSALLLMTIFVSAQKSNNFYVATNGSDMADGQSLNTPFATLERAKITVRKLKESTGLNGPVTVYLRGGTYFLKETFELNDKDGGTELFPVTYTAYNSEKVIISGGKKITGWKPYKKGIWQTKLEDLPGGKHYDFKQLYANDSMRTWAKKPNNGFLRVQSSGFVSNETRNLSNQFEYGNGDFNPAWTNVKDIETIVYHYWSDTHLRVDKIDGPQHTVYFQNQSGKKFIEDNKNPVGARYIIQGILEELDAPGEWYLDRNKGIVYYYPLKGEDVNKVEIIAPVLPALIKLEGDYKSLRPVQSIHFKGLALMHTNWSLPAGDVNNAQGSGTVTAGIILTGASNCLFDKCVIKNISNYAFEILKGCTGDTIRGCSMYNIGAGAIKINGGTEKDHPLASTSGNLIADNDIYNYGQVYASGVGIFLFHTSNNLVTHNTIHDGYYTAISVGGVWGYLRSVATQNIIEYNHIYNIGKGMLSDMGGIYTLGVSPGTIIRNNLIHDIEARSYGGWGIYCDEGSAYILIENNIVYNTQYATFNIHFGKELEVRNNIFCLGKNEQITKGKQEPHVSLYFENNIVYWKQGTLLNYDWSDHPYTYHTTAKADGDKKLTKTVQMDYNLYYNPALTVDSVKMTNRSWAEWKKDGKDNHSLYTDPLFLDPVNFNFTLKENSPAYKLGFRKIDMHQVGARKEKE